MARPRTVDQQLADLVERRARCYDLLIRCINDLAGMGEEQDDLLDAKLAESAGLSIGPDQMT